MTVGIAPFRMQVLCKIAQHQDPSDPESWAEASYLSTVMKKPRGLIVKAGDELVDGGLARRSLDAFKLTVKGQQVYEAVKDVFIQKPSSGPVRPIAEILRGEP